MSDLKLYLPQLSELWQVFREEIVASGRSARALELAQLLLSCESLGPPAIGHGSPDMLYVGRWKNVALSAQKQLAAIAPQLDEAKRELAVNIEKIVADLAAGQSRVGAAMEELEAGRARLELNSTGLAEVTAALTDLRQRLAAVRAYEEVKTEIERALENFDAAQLGECLSKMADILRRQLQADQEISAAMALFPEAADGLRDLPERFKEIDRLLREAEAVMKEQIDRQDIHDQRVADLQG
jgi:tetratricopeptide (TPR) repeat protein